MPRDLNYNIRGDSSDAVRAFDDVKDAAEGAGGAVGGDDRPGGLVGGVGALGGAIAALGIADFITDAGAAAVEVGLLSTQTGLSVEVLSALRAEADQTGVEFDALISSFRTVQDRLVDAAAGGADAQESIERIGLSVEGLLALEPAQQFDAVAQAIADIEDPTERAGAASILLGDDYLHLLAIFSDGNVTLNDVIDRQRELGTVMSEDNVEAAQDMTREMAQLRGQLEAIALDVLPPAASGFQSFFDTLQLGIQAFRDPLTNSTEGRFIARLLGIDPDAPSTDTSQYELYDETIFRTNTTQPAAFNPAGAGARRTIGSNRDAGYEFNLAGIPTGFREGAGELAAGVGQRQASIEANLEEQLRFAHSTDAHLVDADTLRRAQLEALDQLNLQLETMNQTFARRLSDEALADAVHQAQQRFGWQ